MSTSIDLDSLLQEIEVLLGIDASQDITLTFSRNYVLTYHEHHLRRMLERSPFQQRSYVSMR